MWKLIAVALCLCTAASLAEAPVDEGAVMALKNMAEAGDRDAVHRLFGFYSHADGAAAEGIDMILGNVARKHPRLFLEELATFRRSGARMPYPSPNDGCTNLGNTLELADQTAAQIAELRSRRDALVTVTDVRLKLLRDDCIRQLDEAIQDFTR